MVRKIQKKHRDRIVTLPLKIIIFFAVIVTIIIFIRINFKVTEISFEGSTRYTDAQLKERIFSRNMDDISFVLYLKHKFGDKVTIPFVETYDMELVDKNHVKIYVYEKLVIGCVEVMGGYMYFDKDGIVVESANEVLEGVPIVSGLKFTKIILHEALEVQKKNIFDTVLNLTKLIHKHEVIVDKIQFNSDMEVILYAGGSKIFLGKRESYEEQVAALQSVLQSAEGMELSFDMRKYSKSDTTIIATPIEE